MNLQENIQRIKEVMGILCEDDSVDCQSQLDSVLPNAVKKWKEWLNNPTTKQKFQQNHGLDESKVNEIFDKYNKLLTEVKVLSFESATTIPDSKYKKAIVRYIKKNGEGLFGVSFKEVPDTVFVRCKVTTQSYEETIEHEISHLLDMIYPKNPTQKVSNLYNNQEIQKKLNETNLQDFFNKAGITDEKEKERIKEIYLWIINASKKEKRYMCKEGENLIGIQKLRDVLGKNPGQDVTLQEVLPYFTFQIKDFHYDIEKLISCWISKGLPDITRYLNELNTFVKNSPQKNSNLA